MTVPPDVVVGRPATGSVRAGFEGWADPAAVGAYPGYLTDESRLQGRADLVAFPESEAEVVQLLQEAARADATVTVSAGRTGVVGGAVPPGGWVLSVERLDRVDRFTWDQASGEFRLRVGAGVPLAVLRRAIRSGRFPFAAPPDSVTCALLEEFRAQSTRWVFPPDPTEATAQIGGMAASNASGARTFAFGPTRAWVRGLTVVLADGLVLDLARGEHRRGPGQAWQISRAVGAGAPVDAGPSPILTVPAPTWRIPAIKHAAGYFAAPGGAPTDLLDLFIGSEGTLGVITAVEIALRRVEGLPVEVVAFFPHRRAACRFVHLMRAHRDDPAFVVEALEYLCADSLALLQAHVEPTLRRGSRTACRPAAPSISPNHGVDGSFGVDQTVAVFVGLRLRREVAPGLAAVDRLIAEAGGLVEASLAAVGPVDQARLEHLRHALPETVNRLIASLREVHPGITKLGTDMAVPDEHLEAVMDLYAARLREAGLRHVMFGHIGNNHLHVNIIPRTPAEYDRGRALYLEFAREIVALGGSVSAEHGIGKLKKYLLPAQFDAQTLAAMRGLKRALDPAGRLGPGTLFEASS
ncbi:MAG: Glycolate dehydrogenase [Candidatus Ozemobacter sibiricus]|jgi:D-lactate dehydrogenase (cytochrome)|uniref:D-lactate dehydrogenase (cytochrome) n=1 Tax=Candidatus Ozemobacter sibiricus TaxID=2268124 RepID=A0A367ZL25_9BACT|nr:MAG: Glycolate dehydrogenase [Candidatus Ozemobacter sibiricus]